MLIQRLCRTALKRGIKVVVPAYFDDILRLRIPLPDQAYSFPDPSYLESGVAGNIKPDPLGPVDPQLLDGHIVYFTRIDNVLQGRCSALGAKIVTKYDNKITMMVTDTIEDYGMSNENCLVGTTRWMTDQLKEGKILYPGSRPLHFPRPDDWILTKDILISISGYEGQARSDIMQMAAGLGAKATGRLTGKHTHLVCSNTVGVNFAKAIDMNLHIVNHLWLEETYSSWIPQREGKPFYTHFPPGIELMVNRTPQRFSPSTSSRDAPKRYTPVSKKPRVDPDEDGVGDMPMETTKIVFTAVTPKFTARDREALQQLHIVTRSEIERATCLISPVLQRSLKSMIALAQGIPIVDVKWLRDSIKNRKIVEYEPYIVTTPERIDNHPVDLVQTYHLRKANGPLFGGRKFTATPTVNPDHALLKSILQASGATVLLLTSL
jgi:hypothetical protein